MQQKHVITHPDQTGHTRSRHNQNYPEKYFRVTILFSYELQLLCVCYYRSPPEIVYLKCYCQFIFFFFLLIIYFTFYVIFVYFSNFRGSKNRGSMDPVHERGPWTRSIFWWTRSMDPVHGGGPCFVLSQHKYELHAKFHLKMCSHWGIKCDFLKRCSAGSPHLT